MGTIKTIVRQKSEAYGQLELSYSWWQYEMVRLLWKKVGKFLKNFNIHLQKI